MQDLEHFPKRSLQDKNLVERGGRLSFVKVYNVQPDELQAESSSSPHHINNMKFVIFACLAAVAVASPQFGRGATPAGRPIAILRDERQDQGNGNFAYNFETENGISSNVRGTPGSQGQSNMEGSYRFTLPDGGIAEVRFVADENGFRAESPLIPTPHPLPAHAIEQIRIAEDQRRRGITFD